MDAQSAFYSAVRPPPSPPRPRILIVESLGSCIPPASCLHSMQGLAMLGLRTNRTNALACIVSRLRAVLGVTTDYDSGRAGGAPKGQASTTSKHNTLAANHAKNKIAPAELPRV